MTKKISFQQQQVMDWLVDLQTRIIQAMEVLEKTADKNNIGFQKKSWQRKNPDGSDGGGGTMAIIYGKVMEKMAVNISTVDGFFKDDFKTKIPGTNERGDFWASGISLVAHPCNPYVPAIHFNTRLLITGHWWFGGGIDLNPALDDGDEAKNFHYQLQTLCDRHDKNFYAKYKKWCDEYFYIKHRGHARGVGGIFFDQLSGVIENNGVLAKDDFEKYFAFIKSIGEFFLSYYPDVVSKKMHQNFSHSERDKQLIYRGRYAEFNLLYDRGTKFGLETDGNADAILMSLPPLAKWQ
ncbi:MAG: oxygen-dependent coproporphyrinogen oxidase [Alphaproteobacteria bacterium]